MKPHLPKTELWSALIISMIILISALMSTNYKKEHLHQNRVTKKAYVSNEESAELIPFNVFDISK